MLNGNEKHKIKILKKKANYKMLDFNPYKSVITLNVNLGNVQLKDKIIKLKKRKKKVAFHCSKG